MADIYHGSYSIKPVITGSEKILIDDAGISKNMTPIALAKYLDGADGIATITRYGGDATGSTDSIGAWSDALADKQVLILPPGTFRLGSNAILPDKDLLIMGCGMGITNILWDNTASSIGFKFTGLDYTRRITIKDLTLLTSKAPNINDRVFDFNMTGATVDKNKGGFSFSNIYVSGLLEDGTYRWGNGMRFTDMSGINIDGVWIFNVAYGNGIEVVGTNAAGGSPYLHYVTEVAIDNTHILGIYDGAAIKSSGFSEGVWIHGSSLTYCKDGFYATGAGHPNGATPQMHLVSNHINAFRHAAYMDRVFHGQVAHNSIFCNGALTNETDGVYLGEYCQDISVCFNNIYNMNGWQGATPRVGAGITLGSGTNIEDIQLVFNNIKGFEKGIRGPDVTGKEVDIGFNNYKYCDVNVDVTGYNNP